MKMTSRCIHCGGIKPRTDFSIGRRLILKDASGFVPCDSCHNKYRGEDMIEVVENTLSCTPSDKTEFEGLVKDMGWYIQTKEEVKYQENFETTEAMLQFGGSFIRTLGRLWRIGDRDNRRTIQAAFQEYWEKCRKIAKEKREAYKGKYNWYD